MFIKREEKLLSQSRKLAEYKKRSLHKVASFQDIYLNIRSLLLQDSPAIMFQMEVLLRTKVTYVQSSIQLTANLGQFLVK